MRTPRLETLTAKNKKATNEEKLTRKTFAIFAPFAVIIIADTPVRNINREEQEGYERGKTDQKSFRGFRAFRGENYNGAIGDTPFFVRVFRVFRGEIYYEHSLCILWTAKNTIDTNKEK